MAETRYTDFLKSISQYSAKPPLFQPGEKLFWDDPHISKSMLEAHLNPDNDAASRRPVTIDKEVSNLISSGALKPGYKILDLGCGPGLYASRLAEKGIKVTGVDISESSLNYAIAQSKEKGLDIEYRLLNFFGIDYSCEFDAVMQITGELNVFSDEMRDRLLSMLNKALKPGGVLVFDITTRACRKKYGLKNSWYVSDDGFWRPNRHLVLTQGFDYPEDNVWLDRYIVIDDNNIKIYHNWFHDYDLETIRQVLSRAGFELINTWNDLAGTPYQEGGEWIAIVAGKR